MDTNRDTPRQNEMITPAHAPPSGNAIMKGIKKVLEDSSKVPLRNLS